MTGDSPVQAPTTGTRRVGEQQPWSLGPPVSPVPVSTLASSSGKHSHLVTYPRLSRPLPALERPRCPMALGASSLPSQRPSEPSQAVSP